jgi:hypothetical protein
MQRSNQIQKHALKAAQQIPWKPGGPAGLGPGGRLTAKRVAAGWNLVAQEAAGYLPRAGLLRLCPKAKLIAPLAGLRSLLQAAKMQ